MFVWMGTIMAIQEDKICKSELKATIQCSFSKTLFEKGTLELN